MNGTTVFFDLETGGLEPQHPTIQIAAVATSSDWREIDKLEVKLLFNENDCDPEALEMNSYDIDDWRREAVSPPAARAKLQTFFERHATWSLISKKGNHYNTCRIAGHNAAHFDAPRLQALWGKKYAPFAWFYPLDTVHLALWWATWTGAKAPANFQLGTLCEYFEIGIGNAHDALADARATAHLAHALLLVIERESVARAEQRAEISFRDPRNDASPGLPK